MYVRRVGIGLVGGGGGNGDWRQGEGLCLLLVTSSLLSSIYRAPSSSLRPSPLRHLLLLLQQLGLGGVVPKLPGFRTLFYVDEHHLFTLHKSLAGRALG